MHLHAAEFRRKASWKPDYVVLGTKLGTCGSVRENKGLKRLEPKRERENEKLVFKL